MSKIKVIYRSQVKLIKFINKRTVVLEVSAFKKIGKEEEQLKGKPFKVNLNTDDVVDFNNEIKVEL